MLALLVALLHPVSAAAPADFSWLVGTWRGQEGAVVWEESWAPAIGGALLGTFRLVDGAEVRFYELMTLTPDADGGALLRIRHFGPDLAAWESVDGALTFQQSESAGQRVVFQAPTEPTSVVYQRTDDGLVIELRKQPPGAAATVSTFRMGRAAP